MSSTLLRFNLMATLTLVNPNFSLAHTSSASSGSTLRVGRARAEAGLKAKGRMRKVKSERSEAKSLHETWWHCRHKDKTESWATGSWGSGTTCSECNCPVGSTNPPSGCTLVSGDMNCGAAPPAAASGEPQQQSHTEEEEGDGEGF